MSRSVGAILLLTSIGCAGSAPRGAAPGATSDQGAPAAESAPAYERILGAFVISPSGLVLLDPRTCRSEPCGEPNQAEDVVRAAERLGVPIAIAAAKLNLGAVLWRDGDGDAAYRSIRSAQGLFAEAGDAVGLALCHEWIGYMMLTSGETELASDHLALAHQLYSRIGDQPSSDRLMTYLE